MYRKILVPLSLKPAFTRPRLVVQFRHLAPIFACPRPNVEISRTTSNYKFLVAFLNLTFVRRDCGIWDTNVKFTPLVPHPPVVHDETIG